METKAEDSRILLTMAVDYVYLAKKKKKEQEKRKEDMERTRMGLLC